MGNKVLLQEILVVGGRRVTNKDTVSYLKRTVSFEFWIVYLSLAKVLATLLNVLHFLSRYTLSATKICGAA